MKKGASHQIRAIWGEGVVVLRRFGGLPRFGGWHLLLLYTCLMAMAGLPAAGQSSVAWEPDVFSDYLLSGQAPHPAVVRIVAAEHGAASLGSGVLVDANHQQGLVLTNWHVVRDARSAVLVQFSDGFQTAGTVIRMDEAWDLAAVVIWKPPATPIPLAASPPAPGDLLTIAGYGRGPYRAQTGRCTEYLSPGTGYPREFVELAAGARQGDSGGPIINERGELAGVLFGQNGGRTIGSCSTRLRTFLSGVGSSGFSPAAAAADQAKKFRMAAATSAVVEQAYETPGPAIPGGITAALQPPPATGPYAAMPTDAMRGPSHTLAPPAEPAWAPSSISMPTLEELSAIFDVRTNGRAMLSAAGGLALGGLGLRTLFGRRSRPASPLLEADD